MAQTSGVVYVSSLTLSFKERAEGQMAGFAQLRAWPTRCGGWGANRAAYRGDFGLSVGFGGAAAAGTAPPPPGRPRAGAEGSRPALRCCFRAMSREEDFSS